MILLLENPARIQLPPESKNHAQRVIYWKSTKAYHPRESRSFSQVRVKQDQSQLSKMIKVRNKFYKKKIQRAISSSVRTQAIQERASNLKIKIEVSVKMEKF